MCFLLLNICNSLFVSFIISRFLFLSLHSKDHGTVSSVFRFSCRPMPGTQKPELHSKRTTKCCGEKFAMGQKWLVRGMVMGDP